MAKSTSSKTINLNCPGCDALLALDRGFAGGVCRCSTCATLMTVPKLASEKAEKLVRAERPGEPAETPRRDRPDRAERPERPGASAPRGVSQRATAAVRELSDDQLYRTASGREVRVDERRVPMAEAKRKAIRAATVVVFVAVIGGVLGLCGLAAYLLVTQPTAEEIAAASYVETFTYDASANPYAIEAPNLLGLPLSNRVAVVLDPVGMSEPAWSAVSGALLDGLSRDAGSVRVSLWVLEPEGEFRSIVDRAALGTIDGAVVARSLSGVSREAEGVSFWPAVQVVLDDNPEVLILVSGRDIDLEEGQRIDTEVPGEGARFDALLIDADSFELEDVARRTGGHYATLDAAFDLADWEPVD